MNTRRTTDEPRTVVSTAADLGVAACHACALVCRRPPADTPAACPRCGSALHLRKPASLSRTWALLIAATLLYLPANLLPMMYTENLLEHRSDTIVSGVIVLWENGSYDIAVIVFVASVVVPLLKILLLGVLLVSVQFKFNWDRRERATLYRWIEAIGRWSMLDIFVVALLISLVQFTTLGQVRAGSGSIAFGAVVVLTILASKSFDPRLIWDTQKNG